MSVVAWPATRELRSCTECGSFACYLYLWRCPNDIPMKMYKQQVQTDYKARCFNHVKLFRKLIQSLSCLKKQINTTTQYVVSMCLIINHFHLKLPCQGQICHTKGINCRVKLLDNLLSLIIKKRVSNYWDRVKRSCQLSLRHEHIQNARTNDQSPELQSSPHNENIFKVVKKKNEKYQYIFLIFAQNMNSARRFLLPRRF